jgi:hypothetical protein
MQEQVNTPLARAFRQIVTAGWSEQSDGDVSAPSGHFALIPLSARDLPELVDACFDGEDPGVLIGNGHYILIEDSDGNSTLHVYAPDTPENAYLARDEYTGRANEYDNFIARYDVPGCTACGKDNSHVDRMPAEEDMFVCVMSRGGCGHIFDINEANEVHGS